MTSSTVRRASLCAVLTLSSVAMLAGCDAPSRASTSGSTASVSCPTSGGVTQLVGIDATNSARSDETKAINLELIDRTVHRVATCGGYLKVFTFASSTGQTVSLYDGDLTVDAPT